MHITFVKKILADGAPCRKCRDVERRLEQSGHLARIDEVVVADERDPESAGMKLAAELGIDRAPFFIVEGDGGRRVYTLYFRFLKEVLSAPVTSRDSGAELVRANPDLDFI